MESLTTFELALLALVIIEGIGIILLTWKNAGMVPEPMVQALFQMAASYAERTPTKADDQIIDAVRKALATKPAMPPEEEGAIEAQELKKN